MAVRISFTVSTDTCARACKKLGIISDAQWRKYLEERAQTLFLEWARDEGKDKSPTD